MRRCLTTLVAALMAMAATTVPATAATTSTKPTATTEPTATTRPTATTKPSATATTASRAPQDSKLKPTLLKVTDLPDGYTAADPGPAANPGEKICGVTYPSPVAEVGAGFVSEASGDVAASSIVRYPQGAGKRFLDSLAKVSSACPDTTQRSSSGGTAHTSAVPLMMPRYGDQTVALHVTVTSDDSPEATYDLVLIRKGDVMAFIGTFGAANTGPAVQALAKAVAGRLSKVS